MIKGISLLAQRRSTKAKPVRMAGAAILGAAFIAGPACAVTVNLAPSQDVTIYGSGGNVSNGAGQYCFVDKNAMNMIRRTLIKFNLASIPAGSTITAVTLTMHMSMTSGPSTNIKLQRVTASWGEGTSRPSDNGGEGTAATANDATWTYRFYNTTLWTTQGGDFSSTVSATTSVGGSGNYNWSSAQMIADVQQWVNSPSTNFGWIIRGAESSAGDSKRFDTRENPTVSFRPSLSVTYTLPPCSADINHDNVVNVTDLLAVINAWGPCANPNNCPADVAPIGPPVGDDVVNVSDLLQVVNHWGPCP